MEHLQRLYDLSGKANDILAVYDDVMRETQDPLIRHFVQDAIARAQFRPSNPDKAIATIRASLSDDLAMLAKHPAPISQDGTAREPYIERCGERPTRQKNHEISTDPTS